MSKTILIMAGGTGGHVIPALAIARALVEQGHCVEWLGTKRGIESRLVPDEGINLNTIGVEGIRGKGRFALLLAPWMIFKAVLQASTIFRNLQPDLVIGLGGFASGPGGLVAWLKRVPLVIHEQNAVPGTTNKLLALMAKKVLTGFPEVLQGEFVGNPVPRKIAGIPLRSSVNSPVRLSILGGSLGAERLNTLVPEALASLPESIRPVVFHQAGRGKGSYTAEAYERLQVDAEVVEFVDDMASVYTSSDLIICRSGALTVSEVACAGAAATFVPFPYAIDDHQTKNAEWLVNEGAGFLMLQNELTSAALAHHLQYLLTNPKEVESIRTRAHEIAVRDATDRVMQILKEKNYV